MIVSAAEVGFGLAMDMDDQFADSVAKEKLVPVLEDWCRSFAGYHPYHPSRRHPSAAPGLLVEVLNHRGS